MPRLSVAKWRFFQNNPAAWNQFLSQLPRRPAGPLRATPQPSSTPNWQTTASSATPVWTSLGAIYDPVANTWTPVSPPSGPGWVNTATSNCNGGIGDAASIVLTSGTFMLSAACAFPSVDVLFNAATSGWTSTGAPTDPCVPCGGGTYQDEQGYTLLPTGKILTIDVWNPPNAQQ
jgi:hypothetical protein